MTKSSLKPPEKIRKYYYLSLLCLIPNFGVIAGIILLIYAIFVFKSFKLLLVVLVLSIGGFLLRAADINYLENERKYGEMASNLLSKLSAQFLDSVSSKLENYKIKKGQYPENLLVLKAEYPELIITDPLLERNSEIHKSLYFYYWLNGEKYVLFSSGIDCIPNTIDDIFPSINKLNNKSSAKKK